MDRDAPPPGVTDVDHPLALGGEQQLLPVTWWVPTEQPVIGVAWLQHGYARKPHYLRSLAAALTAEGLLVGLPTVESFRKARSINDKEHLDAIGAALAAVGSAGGPVEQVAKSAGVELADGVATHLVLVAHSAGCAVVARAAKRAHEEAGVLRGLVLLDATENLSKTFATSLPALADVEVRGVFAKPSWCNRKGQGAAALRAGREGFVGVRLTTGTHCDAEGDDSDLVCRTMCGRPDPANVAVLYELTTAWTRDLALGRPTPAWEPGGDRLESEIASGRVSVL